LYTVFLVQFFQAGAFFAGKQRVNVVFFAAQAVGDIVIRRPLLKELQKYAGGETLYIPAAGARKAWGEGSGTRQYYAQRNEEIRTKFRRGTKITALAQEFGLSEERVRKIVYGN